MTTKKDATRQRLLEAGQTMALAKGALPHIDVRLTEVLGEVGLTTGAAYNIWTSQDEFRTDLAIEVSSLFRDRTLFSAVADQLEITADQSLKQHLETLATMILSASNDDLSFFLPLRFWAVHEQPEAIAEALSAGYERCDSILVSIIEQICNSYALTTRDEHSVDEVATMAVACLEGFLLRHRIAPGTQFSSGADAALLAQLLYSLVQSSLRPMEAGNHDAMWDPAERMPEAAALAS